MSFDDDNHDKPADPSGTEDARLYVSAPDGWDARLKQTWEKEYCYAQSPGQSYFHLLVRGEIYLVRDNEKYCLACALRRGILTTNRLNWKRGPADES